MHRSRSITGLVAWLAIVVTIALGVAGCLPASIRPTPDPTPGPSLTPTPAPTPAPTPGPPTPTPGPSFALHTVVRGDTLTTLAKKFGTDARSIAYWNRDQYPSLDPESPGYNPNGLQRGWVLRIIPNQAYVPPPGDGETGEQATPTPADDYESASPDASAAAGSGDPSATASAAP